MGYKETIEWLKEMNSKKDLEPIDMLNINTNEYRLYLIEEEMLEYMVKNIREVRRQIREFEEKIEEQDQLYREFYSEEIDRKSTIIDDYKEKIHGLYFKEKFIEDYERQKNDCFDQIEFSIGLMASSDESNEINLLNFEGQMDHILDINYTLGLLRGDGFEIISKNKKKIKEINIK